MITTGACCRPTAVTTGQDDPLVKTWFERIKGAERHWAKFHQRVRHQIGAVAASTTNRKRTPGLQRTARTSSSPPSAWSRWPRSTPRTRRCRLRRPTRALDLRLFWCDTVSTVTQTMLEDAKLKRPSASVRAG